MAAMSVEILELHHFFFSKLLLIRVDLKVVLTKILSLQNLPKFSRLYGGVLLFFLQFLSVIGYFQTS